MCSGGRAAHFIAAGAHQKSVTLYEHYKSKVNRDMFSDFIKIHFQQTCNHEKVQQGICFLQDGCRVQNTKKERQALDAVGAIKFSILPRSPDFNSIENISNYFQTELRTPINYETFKQFFLIAKDTLENTPTKYIFKTIESMPKRMLIVFMSKEKRVKY